MPLGKRFASTWLLLITCHGVGGWDGANAHQHRHAASEGGTVANP